MEPTSPVIARRRVLVGVAGAGAVGLLTQFAARGAGATPEAAKALLQTLAKGEPKEGRIAIRAPEIAENGNAVPVTVAVESPMTDKDHVTAIHVVADGNPNPGVASFTLTPLSGKAEVQIRVRMASTQKIVAVAQMSDGSLWTATREVKVTIGGCGG
ncbi:MAG: thiosulfate oxidation carrier protein SoxY [Alphaproteobacteria bacterium]|nr:thiosulfate oxidation carrier protein SoxY [Alphaproteobacteria bacterium]